MGYWFMTKEQKLFKALIKAHLRIAEENYADEDKAVRLQAAYHAQQAVEKTIKLKAELENINLWGHDIDVLLKKCDDNGIDIETPKYIREKADAIHIGKQSAVIIRLQLFEKTA